MSTHKKYLIAALILFSLTVYVNVLAQTEETITLTTYYPSPYGVYKTLRIFPDGRPAACQEGELYYDDGSSGNPRGLYLCGASSRWWSAGHWTLSGSNLYPNDISWNVGIGTTAPTQKLDVIGYARGSTGLCIGADCRTRWPGSGYERKTSGITGSGEVSATVLCTVGKKVLGGGCGSVDGKVRATYPRVAGNGWVCIKYRDPAAGSYLVQAVAICAYMD